MLAKLLFKNHIYFWTVPQINKLVLVRGTYRICLYNVDHANMAFQCIVLNSFYPPVYLQFLWCIKFEFDSYYVTAFFSKQKSIQIIRL